MKRTPKDNFNANDIFDIAIIGGGITGAGILREAGKRGYKCILIEKNDFAGGTSSKSAKLIHGGLRYLQYGQISLVMESLKDRDYLLENFSHLVKPLPILFPLYKSKFVYEVGMLIYQTFSHCEQIPRYRSLNKEETIGEFPDIDQKQLEGSFIYHDAVTNDARLTSELIHIAENSGNCFAFNYCEFIRFSNFADCVELECFDKISDLPVKFRAKYIINASGPWTDKVLKTANLNEKQHIKPGKGVHLVISNERLCIHKGIIFSSYRDDKRMLYLVPWENDTIIIGATDTEFDENYDNPNVFRNEIDYLMYAINQFAPDLKLADSDIISTFVGLRPLFNDENKQTKDMSRDYALWWSSDRWLNIAGGKLTTFRSMGKACVKKVREKLGDYPNQKQKKVLTSTEPAFLDDLRYGLIKKIRLRYGHLANEVFEICNENIEYQKLLDEALDIFVGEVVYFIRKQSVYNIDDLLTRRFSVSYMIKIIPDYRKIVERIATIFKIELNWSNVETLNQINGYCEKIESKMI